MKIYSWNMLFRNKEQKRALAFIAQSDFDLFCLQEVPAELLEEVLALPFYNAHRIDMVKFFSFGSLPTYNVILSRYPIVGRGEIAYPEYLEWALLRTRIFFYLMRPFYFTKVIDRGALYVDIVIAEKTIRVFNLHLILGHPMLRLGEFEAALAKREERSTIVCGDFNILERPLIASLNWLLGGRPSDAFAYSRERLEIEKRFVAHELFNPLRGKSTHALSRSQLDHILVSKDFSVRSAHVLPDSVGSDHRPIFVELDKND